MKKNLALLLIVSMLISSLAGCGSGAASGEASGETSSEESAEAADSGEVTGEEESSSGEKPTLYVANWQGYVTDQPYSVDVFEEMYDCNVEHVYFNSLEELGTLLQTGGVGNIDCVVSTHNYTMQYIQAGLLQPIDLSLVPNYGDVGEAYRCEEFVYGEGGECYAVPWQWSPNNLGYNADVVTNHPTSWKNLWDEEYAGKVSLGDDYVIVIMLTALSLGMDVSSPENIDLKAVEEALIELKPSINNIFASYDEFLNPYLSGEVVIGDPWKGMATSLAAQGENIQYISPEEGSILGVDCMSIVKDSSNYELAHAWVNFVCGPEFQTSMANAESGAQNPVNMEVFDSLSEERKTLLWCNPLPEKMHMMLALNDEQIAEWSELWNYIKAY